MSAPQPFDAEIVDNYRARAESLGWSLDQMGDHVEAGDPVLAAHLRELAASEPGAEKAAPKGRRSAKAAQSETTEG